MNQKQGIYDLVVIGGGAAGFFGAVNLAALSDGAKVLILEKTQKLLSKVSISGGGRCNVTHHCFEAGELVKNYPRGEKELRQAFMRFQPADTVKWFEQKGVKLKTEGDGRMFPVTDTSQTIVQTLMQQANQLGVQIETGKAVVEIKKEQQVFIVNLADGQEVRSHKVLLACGGFNKKQGYGFIEALGLQVIDPVPSLFTFVVADKDLTQLAGVSVPWAELRVNNLKQTFSGPILITHQGLSGPAVLKLSAFGADVFFKSAYRFQLGLSWLGGINLDEVNDMVEKMKANNFKKLVINAKPDVLPQRLWAYLVQKAGIPAEMRWGETSNKAINKLTDLLFRQQIEVAGKNTFKEEFVTCGGVDLKEVDFRSMESKKVPGLYFAGEVLNIDGVTGGFNFQAAWTTSFLAATHMAETLPH